MRTALLLSLLLQTVISYGQLSVNTSYSPSQLVATLTGPGVVISNITYTGLQIQGGQFNASGTNLGISNGIMLSTANCTLSVGPNSVGNATEDLLQPGDPILDIQAGTQTFDAAILEFDFTPQNDTVSFRYVFASEEYPEYVCSVFNDAFAFLISGPGYPTPTNIAFVPGTSTPVAINTVNVGSSGTAGTQAPACDTSNAVYFVDNIGGSSIEFDGFTVPLTATAVVVPCQTYHLRISIADAGDGGWDSSVFFEAGSLSSTPVVDAGIDRSFCGPGSATIGFSGAPGWNYSWSPSAGLNNPNISNPTVTVSGTTTSTTSFIVTASNGSCIISDTVLVSVSPPPVASFSATDACSGISVPVSFTGSAPPGAVYSWNFGGGAVLSGSGAGPYTVSYPSAGNYTVALQVTVGACTSIAPNQTISIHPSLLPPQAVVSDVTCSGIPNGSIQVSPLGGTGPFQISWSPNVSATFTANSLAAGNYTATVTDVNGCTSTASYPVYEPFPLVAVATGVPALCAGSPSGTVSVSAQGGSTPYSYSWLNGGATTSAISGLLAGNYTCMVTDANGCTTSAMANVAPQITVIPVALATPATICPGENVSLQVTGGLSYFWSDGATDSIRVVNPGSTTQYSVIATDQNGCTGSDSLIVQVAQQPQALFSVQPVCFEDTSSFKQQSSVSSGIISNYSWNFGDGNTSAGTQPKHFYSTPGTYPVTLVVNTNAGCVDSLTLYAVVHPLPIANWTSGLQYGCIPLPVDFTAQTVNGLSYQWAFGSLIGNESSPTVIFDQPGKYSVMLSVTDANGCTDDTLTVDYVEAYPVPESGFFINPNYVTELMPRVELMDASLGAVDWYWDFGDTTVSSDREPSHTYAYPGTYEIRQVVRNNFGCIDTLVRTLEVGRDYAFYIPNAFTPNGDGTNDFFEVKGYNYFGYRIEIFNRWGKQVFISENPEVSWDGSQRGEHAQQGVYDYAVDFKDVFGKPHKLFGRVTVIR